MATRINFLSPKSLLPQFTTFPIKTHPTNPSKLKLNLLCKKMNMSDAELAMELSTEVSKLKTQIVQREEALKKSKELLFTELCNYMGLKDDEGEAKKQWMKMDEDEKWVLVKGFVSSGWGANFHPLSAKSVKQMVGEYLIEQSSSSSSSNDLFHGLKRLMGFSQDSKGESSLM